MARTPEQKLFLSVIVQAIHDASYKGVDVYCKIYKRAAISWLTSNSKDFRFVCTLADLDPDRTYSKLLKAIKYDISELKDNYYIKQKPEREYRPGRYRLKFD